MKNNIIQPWERQLDDTNKSFEAFCIYRDMGRDRALSKVAAELGKTVALIERWSSKFNWVKRCEAWDDEQDRVAREAQLNEIKKMRKRHADLATAMLLKSARALQRLPEDEIKAQDISRMVDVASRLERISRGDVGDVIEERDGGQSAPAVTFYMPSNGRDQDAEEE